MGINPVFTQMIVDLSALESGQSAQSALAVFAAEKRDEVIAQDHPSTVDTWVDGSHGVALSNVKAPDGVIRFEFGYMREVVAEVFNMLVIASPYRDKSPSANVKTHYKDENLIFVNGVMTDDITNLTSSDEVIFVNVQPYSRKIEGGPGRAPISLQAPHGVYQAVANAAKRRFGNTANIQFNWVGVVGVMAAYAGSSSKSVGETTRKKANKSENRWPAITITPVVR